MAKQQRRGIGPSGVVMAAAAESQQRGQFIDYGDAFMKGYDRSQEAKKKAEAEAEATLARSNAYMDQFENDIDVIKFKPEDQAIVKNTITGWRSEYAEAANAAAKIQDKTSPEYQKYMDTMNGIKARMSNLKNNIDNLAKHKAEYYDGIKNGMYSATGTNQPLLMQGQVMVEMPIGGITADGDLTWGEGDNQFTFQNRQKPILKATEQANAVLNMANKYDNMSKPFNEIDRQTVQQSINNIFSNNRALESIMADNEFGFFDFSGLDPAKAEDREEAKRRMAQGIEDVARKTYSPPKGSDGGTGDLTSKQKELREEWANITSSYDNGVTFNMKTLNEEQLRFVPHKDGNKTVWTKYIYQQDLADDGYNPWTEDMSKGGTHEWTIEEIQGLFGYKF